MYHLGRRRKKTRRQWPLYVILLCVGGVSALVGTHYYDKTSTNEACSFCHAHPEATASWKQSKHVMNSSGVMTNCTDCHLPPRGTFKYHQVKIKTGLKDLWSNMIYKPEEIDFESKRDVEYAKNLVFNESCIRCHADLFPSGLSDDGVSAHLYFEENAEKQDLHCISCHLDVGHVIPGYSHKALEKAPIIEDKEKYTEATMVSKFENFEETVPTTSVTLSMKAIPGGEFMMGSDEKDPFSQSDEYPKHKVKISRFFMSEVEVTWDQYWAFYVQTMSDGRTPPAKVYAQNTRPDLDAVAGPTPPFGMPDQGWGMGSRPAITMTHYAAETFCLWLSLKTGKKYRLPTEAEWEYAARGGTTTPYFFEGKVRDYSEKTFWNKIFGADTTTINGFVVYAMNSKNRTQEPTKVRPNPFGLKNMLGNVMEYCSDWYAEDAYTQSWATNADPTGPSSGESHVVRGGCYADDASALRCAARQKTDYDQWLKTDPQNPKSIWWLSDIKGIGFRVVCEVPEGVR